jgi:hypothetical protein
MKSLVAIIVALVIALIPGHIAFAQRTTATHTAVNCTTSSTQMLAANVSRNFLILQNDSDTTVYLKFGATAVLNEGIRLNSAGGSMLLDYKFVTQAVNCIHGGTGNKVLLVTSGTQ